MLLGSGAVCDTGAFRADIFALALLTTLPFQVLSDYANDYGDAVKGTDDDGRLGPRRAIQTGQMSARHRRYGASGRQSSERRSDIRSDRRISSG